MNDTVTSSASALVAAPVTISCTLTGGVYSPGPAQTVSVTSAAAGGTPFTLDTTSANDPAWLTINPSAPAGTATSTATTFTVAATAGCGSFASGSSHTVNLHLQNAPAPDKLVAVTLQVVPPSPLTVTPIPAAPSISLSYVKGSGSPGSSTVSVTSSVSGAFFSVNTASLPIWLTVNVTSGTAPRQISFTTTGVADSLAPGTYTASVYLKVSGYADLPVNITLLVTNKAPKLSVSSTSIPLTWVLGTAPPTTTITALSTDSPIQYTITTGGTLAPIVSSTQQSGLAYSFGTQIGVTFNSLIFATAQPGTVLTGTVTFTWGSPASTTVVTISLTVVSPGATLSGLSPASLPTAVSGTSFPVVLTGTGFVGGTDPTLKTKVGIVVGGVIVADTNLSVNVVNPSNIILTIVVPGTADPNLPFSPTGTGGTVALGLCNGTCTIPTGTATLTIGGGPIIQGVTSSSAFVEVTPPAIPTVAPYDMISLFGANFCSSVGTGCSTTQILMGSPDPLTLRFPTTLSPDAAGATQRQVSANFLAHGTTTVIGAAPLLFATNGQINLIVPAAVSGYVGSATVDIVVSFGYGSGTTLLKSSPFTVNVAATDPGVFTIGSDGQGSGAALSASYALITSTNPAGMRSTGADSDTIQLYVTGLGAPDSTADNTATGTGTPVTDCIAATTGTGNYMATLPIRHIRQPRPQQHRWRGNPECAAQYGPLPAMSVDCAHGYRRRRPCDRHLCRLRSRYRRGTLSDQRSAACNQRLDLVSLLSADFLPDHHPHHSGPAAGSDHGGRTDQPGRRYGLGHAQTASDGSDRQCSERDRRRLLERYCNGDRRNSFVSLCGNLRRVARGSHPRPDYRRHLRTPAANTAGSYAVTITATDSANVPLTGTYSMTIVVAGGLYMTDSGTSPYSATFGTASPSLMTVTATGGTYPYTYAITAPATAPAGMAISNSGVVSTTALTPAGIYNGIVITATDSSSTPLTGTSTFQINVGLQMTHTTPTAQTGNGSGILTTVTAAGGSGTIVYTLDSASTTAGFTIDGSGNLEPTTASSGTYTVIVTATDSVTMAPGATGFGTGTTTVSVTVN